MGSTIRRYAPEVAIVGVALALATAMSAHMYYLRAPAVVATRPELEEIGFWTALFSGRFTSWAWLHHAPAALVVTFALWLAVAAWVIYG